MRWLGLLFLSWIIWVVWGLIFPGFPVETRTEGPGGVVDFNKKSITGIDAEDWINGIEDHTKFAEAVQYMIYGKDAVYLFTTRGRVFALSGNESGVPASILEIWEWSGHPHDFPYYHEYNLGGA